MDIMDYDGILWNSAGNMIRYVYIYIHMSIYIYIYIVTIQPVRWHSLWKLLHSVCFCLVDVQRFRTTCLARCIAGSFDCEPTTCASALCPTQLQMQLGLMLFRTGRCGDDDDDDDDDGDGDGDGDVLRELSY